MDILFKICGGVILIIATIVIVVVCIRIITNNLKDK